MSFEAESNSELTVIVPAHFLRFRFPVQNKIHKQKILSDTWPRILGSIAVPCDFLPARSDEFQKVWQNIVVFFIWTPCQVSVSVTEIFFISIYLKHREREELEKEKSNLEKEEIAMKEEEATNEQSTLQMEIKELKEKLDTLER